MIKAVLPPPVRACTYMLLHSAQRGEKTRVFLLILVVFVLP